MVGFRWFAKQHADMLDIKGYVRNTSRGNVEILAQGKANEIQKFTDYLKMGPSRSNVTKVRREPANEANNYSQFSITM